MSKVYEAPALTLYGSVSALTSSGLKCTPGGDGGFTEHFNGYTFNPDTNEWELRDLQNQVIETRDADDCFIQ